MGFRTAWSIGAKKKIERGKVRFDATIAKLQKERKQMMDTGASLKAKESKAEKEGEKLEELNLKVKAKLNSYQELYDHNQRMIVPRESHLTILQIAILTMAKNVP